MRRTNTFEVRPRTAADRELLLDLLDASSALWNEVNYERRQRFFDGDSIWDTADWRARYKETLGSATAQQILRKNASAWKSFLALNEQWRDGERDTRPQPPGYWGNGADGREHRTYFRNDQYTLQWGTRSRLEIPVGRRLKEEYDLGYNERLRLEAVGEPRWDGDPGRLELTYDAVADTFRAFQPVTVPDSRRDSPLAAETAALDVGANTLVAATTTTGTRLLYDGRLPFEQFHATTERIAEYQSKLPDGRHTSERITRLFRRRTRRRNHAQDALVRDLVTRLYEDGVARVYVGDLGDVLRTHWSTTVNEKTHLFWAFSRLIDRLECVCAEYGIEVVVRSEAYTTQECPDCRERNRTQRRGSRFRCENCGFAGHADLKASRIFLDRVVSAEQSIGPMARPVRLGWTDHTWQPLTTRGIGRFQHAESCTDRSTRGTTRSVGKIAAGASRPTPPALGGSQSYGW